MTPYLLPRILGNQCFNLKGFKNQLIFGKTNTTIFVRKSSRSSGMGLIISYSEKQFYCHDYLLNKNDYTPL
jgi:hypothetical protein